MKRAGRIFALPLVLLALVLQAGAAIAATRAQAEAANPFASIPICSPDKAKTGGKQNPIGEHGDHHCAMCLIGAVAHAVPLADVEIAIPGGVLCAATPALARHVQPRGPPTHAPRARGPPTLA